MRARDVLRAQRNVKKKKATCAMCMKPCFIRPEGLNLCHWCKATEERSSAPALIASTIEIANSVEEATITALGYERVIEFWGR